MESVSIVILNYQSYKDTICLVENLSHQKDIDCYIIIVDNASPNNSFSILKKNLELKENIFLVQGSKNGGYSFGNNIGLKYIIKNKLPGCVIILNNDIYLKDPYLINRLIKEFKKLPDAAFVAPVMQVNGKDSSNSAFGIPSFFDHILSSSIVMYQLFGKRQKRSPRIDYKKEEVIATDCLPGSFFLGNINTFKGINFFDENVFLYGEEYIIGHKIKNLNLKNYLISSLNYEHKVSQTIDENLSNLKKANYLAKSKIYFQKKYNKINFFKKIIIYLFEGIRRIEYIFFSNFLKK